MKQIRIKLIRPKINFKKFRNNVNNWKINYKKKQINEKV